MANIVEVTLGFLRTHFEAPNLKGEVEEDGTVVSFRLTDEGFPELGCLALIDERSQQVVFYTVVLEHASEERRLEVMRFVTLANYGMQVGNFEIDLDDGEVRFRTSVDVEGLDSFQVLLRNLIELNIRTMALHCDGLLSVMQGITSAAEAMAEIEGDEALL